MHKWDPLNRRQSDVLNRIAAGEGVSLDSGAKRSARALQDRGLLRISRRDGVWTAELTDDGHFYLDHGHDPERQQPNHDAPVGSGQSSEPRTPQPPRTTARIADERRRAADELVATLRDKRRIDIVAPDEDTIAHWRKVVDFAKRHRMVPQDTRSQSSECTTAISGSNSPRVCIRIRSRSQHCASMFPT